mmetsp:Transcript_2730/g.10446  ORF Transcript_2730/g.10446 Transcript_2730/m.10446 type:complete len:300 (-) Transcript_2730:690-1589(-)
MWLTFANTAAYVPGSTPVAGPWGDAFGNALSVPKDSRKLTCDVKSLILSSYATSMPGARLRRGFSIRDFEATRVAYAFASSPFITSAKLPIKDGTTVCVSSNAPSGGRNDVALGSNSTSPGWNRHPPARTSPSHFQPYNTVANELLYVSLEAVPLFPVSLETALPGQGMGKIAPRIPTGSATCHTSPVLCVVQFSANSMVSGSSSPACLYCRKSVTFCARELCSAKLTQPGPDVGPNELARDTPRGVAHPGAAPTGTAKDFGGSLCVFRRGPSKTVSPPVPSSLSGFRSTSTKFISSGA